MLKTNINALVLIGSFLLFFGWAPKAQAGFGSFIDFIIENRPVRTQLDTARLDPQGAEVLICEEAKDEPSQEAAGMCVEDHADEASFMDAFFTVILK